MLLLLQLSGHSNSSFPTTTGSSHSGLLKIRLTCECIFCKYLERDNVLKFEVLLENKTQAATTKHFLGFESFQNEYS